jgi:hypothetical protein
MVGWLGAFHLLSPFQWMNVTWGVQTCYTGAVFGTLMSVLMIHGAGSPMRRTLLASFFAAFGCLSYINAWLAWGLIGLRLVTEGWQQRKAALALLLSLMGITAAYFLADWPAAKVEMHSSFLGQVMAQPLRYAEFFIGLIGAPFSDYSLSEDHSTRMEMQQSLGPWLGMVSLVLFGVAMAMGWRRRNEISRLQWVPWVLLAWFGLANVAAITMGRGDWKIVLPYDSRYVAHTFWFHVAMLVFLGLARSRVLRMGIGAWIVFAWIGGGLFGAWQGFRYAARSAQSAGLFEAATALRHIVPEPQLIGLLVSREGGLTRWVVDQLDRMEEARILPMGRIASDKVSDARLVEGWAGQLDKAELTPEGQLMVEGWAASKKGSHSAPSVVLSIQTEGEAERWCGIANDRPRRVRLAEKLGSSAHQARLGWRYEPEPPHVVEALRQQPTNHVQRLSLPKGTVTLRAYVFLPRSGEFSRLAGEATLTLK